MNSKIIELLQDKKIVILGFGVEGKSTYNFIRKYLKEQFLVIMDHNYENIEVDDSNISITNIDYSKMNEFDLVIKTPGISFRDVDTSSFIDKVTSQLELLLETTLAFTVGITGSKGKSTTSSLINAILKSNNKDSFLIGNIGRPAFEVLDEIDMEKVLVIEMSSHQLEFMKCSPKISLITNLFEEHLDHYKDADAYYMAKMNICKYQEENNCLLYTSDNETLNEYINKLDLKSTKYNITYNKFDNSDVYIENDFVVTNGVKLFNINTETKLQGKHNLKNIMYALKVSEILNLDLNKSIKAICEFEPLPHRMELVGTYNNITYYNDSIATIPSATVNGVETLNNVNTLIIGGKDRTIDYQPLVDFINNSNIENLICIPETGHTIGLEISGRNVYNVENLKEAVTLAKQITKPNTICLLSPAAASYGFFKNFEERGNLFKEYVRKEE